MKQTMSSENFLKAKEIATGKDPLVKKVVLGNLNLNGLEGEIPTIQIDDLELRVSNGFINALAKHLNIGGNLNKMFRGDPKAKAHLIRAIKSYAQKGKNGGQEILLLGGAHSKRIESLATNRSFGRITNESLFNIAEGLLNRYKNLGVESIHDINSGLHINMILKDQIEFKNKSFKEKEVFNFGLTLKSDFTTTEVADYNMRLICDNGMEYRQDVGRKTIIKDIKEIDKLYDRIHHSRGNQFIPSTFKERLILCNETYASLAEVERGYEEMSNQIDEKDENTRRQFEQSMKDNFFQGIRMTEKRVRAAGYDMEELKGEEKEMIRTPMKVWDLINSLTTLASNDHGFPMKRKASAIGKVRAGEKMFGKKDPDLARLSRVQELIKI